MSKEKHPRGYNGPEKRAGKSTPLKHSFEITPVQQAIEKLERNEELASHEDDLLLTTGETATVLTIVKQQKEGDKEKKVSTRYIPQLVRAGKLEPAAPGSGRSYLYRMGDVRNVDFGSIGRPSTGEKTA